MSVTAHPHRAQPDDESYIGQLPDYSPPTNGNGTVVALADYDDDVDDGMLQLQARTEQLAHAYEQREAGRVHRKVTASATGAALAGGVPAILAAVNGLNLPPELQPLVLAAAAVIGTFVAGYVTPERKPAV